MNDVVMGGQSSSALSSSSGDGLTFTGNISVDGGGFASCRTKRFSVEQDNPSSSALGSPIGADGIVVTIRYLSEHILILMNLFVS